MKANIGTLVVIVLAVVFLGAQYVHEPWTAMRIAGVMVGLPSLVLLVVARIELGGSFSVRPKAQGLVTHGLYSRVTVNKSVKRRERRAVTQIVSTATLANDECSITNRCQAVCRCPLSAAKNAFLSL